MWRGSVVKALDSANPFPTRASSMREIFVCGNIIQYIKMTPLMKVKRYKFVDSLRKNIIFLGGFKLISEDYKLIY